MNNGKHLSLEDRKTIEDCLRNNLNKTQIAKIVGKDPSTIAKEIKKRRIFKQRNIFNADSICIHLKECGACLKKCERYEELTCSRRDKLGVCNNCTKITNCKLDKFFYRAIKANEEYLQML